ncbi:MAG TPA: Maf family protein [Phototrophicaceae bacterium]|nr:Maf family protein [Phototrophicaceae bacterium]
MTPAFILASSSPRRRELLTTLGLTFTIIKPQVDETQQRDEAPLAYVRRLSQEKAAAVAARLTEPAAVLAADTIVVLGADTLGVDERGAILGKPADADDARAMLRRLRGRVHQVYTALTLLVVEEVRTPAEGVVRTRYIVSVQDTRLTRTDVTMRNYTDAEIETYIASGDPFDKAGSYAIQHPEFKPVAHIDGSYTNVVGLPVETLRAMLADIGWPVRDTV